MTSITIDVPSKQSQEYREILLTFVEQYDVAKLKEIAEKQFYLDMLDGVFSEKGEYKEIIQKDGKLDFSDLLK